MITRHLFGRSIDFRIIPIADDQEVSAYSLSSARIYSTAPTLAQKQNTASGHIEEVTSWTEVSQGEYKIVFAALTDSDPESSDDYETYHVVVNFRYESGGAIVFVDEAINVFRPDALTSRFRVTKQDVYRRESKIETVEPRINFVDDKIQDAMTEVDRVLRARGYSRKRTFNRERMNEAVALLATADCCSDLAGEDNQFWLEKAALWRKRYEEARDSIPIGFDADNDDVPEETETVFSGAFAFVR